MSVTSLPKVEIGRLRWQTAGCLISILLFSTPSHAQPWIQSLFTYSPSFYNPAFSATDNWGTISAVSQKTNVVPGVTLNRQSLAANVPLILRNSGRRFGGVGFSLAKANSTMTHLLEKVDGYFTAAYNLPVRPNQFVSFGLQSGFHQQSFDLANLTTGSQWMAAQFQFDPAAPLGETILQNKDRYVGLNGGAIWYWEHNKEKRGVAHIGISVHDLNINAHFPGDQRLRPPVSYLMHAGGFVFHRKQVSLNMTVFYQKDVFRDQVGVASVLAYTFENANPFDVIASGCVSVVSKWDATKGGSVGLSLEQPSCIIGFAYQTPLGLAKSATYYQSQIEVGVVFRKRMWREKVTKVQIESAPVVTRKFDFDQAQTPVKTTESEIARIQEKIEEFSGVRAGRVQFQLEKHFNFTFGRSDLDEKAKAFLDELLKLLQQNPTYQLEVIGHTDNSGKSYANYRLSLARALAVVEYLKGKGIDAQRLKHAGKGDAEPVVPNDTEEGRARNRRVQFIIYADQ